MNAGMRRAQRERPTAVQDVSPRDVSARTPLLTLSVGLVEDVRGAGLTPHRVAEGFSPEFQLALPYRGLFIWHVGRDAIVGDANQVLFVTGGEGYRMSHPIAGGYAELIVTPTEDVLSELTHASGVPLAAHPLFRRRSRRATPGLQSFRARFLSWANATAATDDLAAEELVLALLRSALDGYDPCAEPGGSTRRLIRRAKAFLEAELANPIRLTDVASAVGASPAYLTHVFRCVEGTSLHRYLMQLRLARALLELPHADDLTTLAIDIGFSSHSHFTAVFRRTFGTTPSQFRQTSRNCLRPSPP
jgi:AraC family transcriptional regulator